tara:strand:+ start:5085 stop:5285 length:201 start_codon:yes stop_codon:yes gene_type:complete
MENKKPSIAGKMVGKGRLTIEKHQPTEETKLTPLRFFIMALAIVMISVLILSASIIAVSILTSILQ